MRLLTAILFLFLSLTAPAQETSRAFTVGVGATNVYDSYLTPIEYSGIELRVQREILRPTHLMHDRVYFQNLFNAHASYTRNPSKSGKMYEGIVNWNLAWLYQWRLGERFIIRTGPMADMNAGVIYNKRNQNNPAQAKAYVNADVSAMVYYRFRMFRKPFRLRYQVSLPLIGVMFSPEYGESYYEMFGLKHGGGHNVCVTTPFSQPSLRHSLYLDFSLRRTNLRVGYVGDWQQSRVNQLRSHTYSNAFMVGIIRHFEIIKKPIP